MELSHSLTLNEEALNQLPEAKKPVFVFEWLRFLDKVLLVAAQKSDIKEVQKKLVEQLTAQIQRSPGPPTRRLLAKNLATLFSVGDTLLLFETVNKCNDTLKNKDDSPSFLANRLAAICVLGCMYEKLGRMMGRSYEETVQILLKSLRSAESQTRIEIMITLEKLCAGMGGAIVNVHKDIYKAVRHCLADRVMAVRVAASNCLLEMLQHASFLYTTELESMASLCFRAFDGSNYEVRCAVAKLLGNLVALTQTPAPKVPAGQGAAGKVPRVVSLDEALGILMGGFLRGGVSFLKGTEMIKGTSNVNREVRVGITHAYVVFFQVMGAAWIERNMQSALNHILDLVANPKAASSHVDAVYSRKCINFILHSVIGKMLGEKAQSSACKELVHIIAKQMNSIDFNPENAKDANQETLFSQHLLVCALQELGSLVIILGTTAQNLLSDHTLNLIDAVCAVLVHPCIAARLAAGWCLRCICVAVPSQITALIDRFTEALEKMRTAPDAISGYSGALAAVMGAVRLSPLGIPHTKGKIIFNVAEELLRTASQNSRLSLNRTQAGWLLIGAIMTLGVPVVKSLLPRMLLLWRNAFPRSTKELESEKARGDAFTWQVTLEGRAGALSVMHSFLSNCPELVTDEIIRRLLTPIESALAMLINITSVLKSYGQHLKAPAAMVRLRLYETLSLLPANCLESSYTHLLRMLVSEFTLTDNPANTTTSLLRELCHAENSIILALWLQEKDHQIIEDQLQPTSAAGSGALEHDCCSLYRPVPDSSSNQCPGPLPLGVAVIDMSTALFGLVFPHVANKHRLQMVTHFAECIKHAKSSRQEAVQMNIFTALICGLKGLTETKSTIGQDDVKATITNLILGGLTSANPILRCAAGEALGRLAQVVGDSRVTAELAQNSFNNLKSARDVVTRTGHSLALGCLHRYVGGMGSSQHLSTSVSILLALAADGSSPVVQVWALYALSLIADSGGPMFRSYVEPALSLCLKLLLAVPQSCVDVHQCIGRVLSALITTVGPELQGNVGAITAARSSFLCAAAVMQMHPDPLVQAEATGCLQQLHLFAPKYVNLATLVPTLCRTLFSNYLTLRKAAVSCLRQLTTREAKEVCEHAVVDEENFEASELGLPGVLFAMLDKESDAEMIRNIHDTLISMLQMLAADNLSQWLSLCKNVLTVAVEEAGGKDTELDQDEGDDDNIEFHAEDTQSSHALVQPRWPTRVFASECVRKIITTCEAAGAAHFDMLMAKEMQMTKSKGDYLVLHISDLIRMAFMAATSDSDHLRLEGMRTLQEIIQKFARIPEPEFPGHLLLEQFQAQVGAALRPAFAADTPPHVTAAACEVCSAWIGSGVARDLNDLRRVHQLLVSSLSRLQPKTGPGAGAVFFNESMATLEKLSILKAWAQVYIVAMIDNGSAPASQALRKLSSSATTIGLKSRDADDEFGEFGDFESRGESLLSLVQPELESLSGNWLAALKDYALLSLPAEFASQLPHDGGAFYTNDTMNMSKPHYHACWPPILHAATLWLNAGGFDTSQEEKEDSANNNGAEKTPGHGSVDADRFYLIFGVSMEALCSTRSAEKPECIVAALQALYTLLSSRWARHQLTRKETLAVELCNVLHRMILTRDSAEVHLMCVEILKQNILAVEEQLEATKAAKRGTEETADNAKSDESKSDLDYLGEGGESGDIEPGSSHVYAVLEVVLCLLVRQIPTLNPSQTTRLFPTATTMNGNQLGADGGMLVASAVQAMENLTKLCSPKGALQVLPTLLFLATSVIKEVATKSSTDPTILANTGPLQAVLHLLKALVTDKYAADERIATEWSKLLQSALAKVLDLTKTGSDDSKMDEVTMMSALGVFILHARSSLVAAPNLQYPCINYFRQCLQSDSDVVRLRCIQTMRQIFGTANLKVSAPYIHTLAPLLVENLYLERVRAVKNDVEFAIVSESISSIETLIELAEPQNRDTMQGEWPTFKSRLSAYDTQNSFLQTGIQMLTILVPILINYLIEPSQITKTKSKYCVLLHEQSLQRLQKIGPKYPQEFKVLMARAPEQRNRLEAAIRNSQQRGNLQKLKNDAENATKMALPQQQQPTIKLKMDFSNFNKN